VLELSDDRFRVETDLARIGPKESTCEETARELPEVLAFNGIQKGCSNLRARRDLSKGQPCPHARLLKAFADVAHSPVGRSCPI